MIQIVHGANRRATSFGKIAAQLISVRGLIRPRSLADLNTQASVVP